jgi:DNA-binding NtrC family response regulator
MARIILIDSDESHAKTVASALARRDHQLTVYANARDLFRRLSDEHIQFTVVILNFSNRPEDWDSLDKLRKLTLMCVPRPGILCLSRSKWGTDVRLQVERKGARLVYE